MSIETPEQTASSIVEVWLDEIGVSPDPESDGKLITAISAAIRVEGERAEKEHSEEIGEFQQKAYELICRLSGKDVDGAGSDAGWQEFTLAEIAEGLSHVIDRAEKAERELAEAVNVIEDVLKGSDPISGWPIFRAFRWLERRRTQGVATFERVV